MVRAGFRLSDARGKIFLEAPSSKKLKIPNNLVAEENNKKFAILQLVIVIYIKPVYF